MRRKHHSSPREKSWQNIIVVVATPVAGKQVTQTKWGPVEAQGSTGAHLGTDHLPCSRSVVREASHPCPGSSLEDQPDPSGWDPRGHQTL